MRTLHLSSENVPRCIPERGNCSYAPLQLDSYSKTPAATATTLRIHPLCKAPAATSSPLYIHSYSQTPAATPTPRQIYLFSGARCNSISSLPIPLRLHPGRLVTLLQIQSVLRTQLRRVSSPSRVQTLITMLKCDSSASLVLRMRCAALSAHAHFGAQQLHAPRIAGGR